MIFYALAAVTALAGCLTLFRVCVLVLEYSEQLAKEGRLPSKARRMARARLVAARQRATTRALWAVRWHQRSKS